MPSKKPDFYRANQGFATMLDGENVFVQQGEIVRAGHPILEGREELFDEVENFGRFDQDVEQATAAPGEKRGAKKKADEAEEEADGA
jgi:hypothetical protein